MSDPREFERDPSLKRDASLERDPSLAGNRYVGKEPSRGMGTGWLIAAVVAIALLGLAAYSYRDTQTSSTAPATTTGEGMRAPVPSTPPAAPVAPAPRP